MKRQTACLTLSTVLALTLLLSSAQPANAIVVNANPLATENPAANQVKPNPSYNIWDHVGQLGNGTGVYLGSGFVLTANHVSSFNTFNLNGTDYSRDLNAPVVRLKNDDNTSSDLKIFQINGDPGLPFLPISSNTVQNNDSVQMIGTGRVRGSAFQPTGNGTVGYAWSPINVREKTWASNTVSDPTSFSDDTNTLTFPTQFNQFANGDGQATQFDSGAGIFRYNTNLSRWELIGSVVSVTGFVGQDASTAAFGNLTNAADLTAYRTQIYNIIPEPASIALLASGAILLLRRQQA